MKFIQPLIATLAISLASFLFVVPTPIMANNIPNVTVNPDSSEVLVLKSVGDTGSIEFYLNKKSIVDFVVNSKDNTKQLPLRYFEVNINFDLNNSSPGKYTLISAMVTDCAVPGRFMSLNNVTMFRGSVPGRVESTHLKPILDMMNVVCTQNNVPDVTPKTIDSMGKAVSTHNNSILQTLTELPKK